MTILSETRVKATRKQHQCDACLQSIVKGSPAVRWSGISDGEFQSGIFHPDCREAELALNDCLGWYPGDDWTPLHNIESDDLLWLEQEHPTVFARMFPGRVGAAA